MRMTAALLGLSMLAGPAAAQTAIRWMPEAGSHSYRYETVSHVPAAPGNSFRLDYDLVSDGKGGAVAVVKAAGHRDRDAGEWNDPPEVDAACRAELHGQGDELARVTLTPIAPGALETLGTSFLADCAPADIFFPVADVLMLTLLEQAPKYRLAELAKPGDSRRFPGYKSHIDRLDTVLDLDAPGGTVTLVALTPERATVEWSFDPVAVKTIHRRAYSGADVTLAGTQNRVLRAEIDPRTGVLLRASTVRDQLDLTMSLPGDFTQPLVVTQEVTVTPLP